MQDEDREGGRPGRPKRDYGEHDQSAAVGSVRVGIESAGHYHRALATTLRSKGFDVVELNPYQVKMARANRARPG